MARTTGSNKTYKSDFVFGGRVVRSLATRGLGRKLMAVKWKYFLEDFMFGMTVNEICMSVKYGDIAM